MIIITTGIRNNSIVNRPLDEHIADAIKRQQMVINNALTRINLTIKTDVRIILLLVILFINFIFQFFCCF